jgi:uracil-DNA glycosylase family 4
MDRERSRHYLRAMGVQVWRRRDEDEADEQADADPAPPELAAQTTPCEPPETSGPRLARPDRKTSEGAPVADPAGMDWDLLSRAVSSCRACELHATRTRTVFGVGNREADLMIIGEAPGADEDRQGEPFVGRAGQLLNLMLQAIGLKREQVYIANILKCRPPGNRDPRPGEALRCKPYLMRQIALIQPQVLLSVGRISAQNLLETDTPIGRLRGRWREFGPDRTPLMVTYHPAYLLRSPEQKSKTWKDLLQVAHRLREASGD